MVLAHHPLERRHEQVPDVFSVVDRATPKGHAASAGVGTSCGRRRTRRGASPRRITDHAATDVDPAISPDERDIIFTSNRTGNNDIFLVDSRGGMPFNLTKRSGK
jgi:hypothetical protein